MTQHSFYDQPNIDLKSLIAQSQPPEAQPQSHKKPFSLGQMRVNPPFVELEWLVVALRLGFWRLRLGNYLSYPHSLHPTTLCNGPLTSTSFQGSTHNCAAHLSSCEAIFARSQPTPEISRCSSPQLGREGGPNDNGSCNV